VTPYSIRKALACGKSGCTCGQPRGLTHCPAHADSTPSLSVTDKDGKLLVKCFGGCDQDRVTNALKSRGLWLSDNGDQPQVRPRIVVTYNYQDASSKLVFQVCRLEPKSFRQRRPDGAGGWIWNMTGVDRVPYRLPEILQAGTVYVVEGEKDVATLERLGLTATTNPGGAGKWRKEYNQYFQKKAAVILSDNDEPGRAHAVDVARQLHGVAASVKVLDLPGLPEKGDVSDWLKAGGTREQLRALVEAVPEWRPREAPKSPPQSTNPKSLTPQAVAQTKTIPQIRFVSGRELEALDFPEPVWIIPNILGEGYIILAGRPKLGKSWLGLCLAVAVATGGYTLGKTELRATQGKVLYLGLEDKLRRLQKRLKQILGDSPFPDDLLLAESWPRLDKGGLEALQDFLKEHDDCRLVVIDTLAKVRPPRQKNIDPYEHDAAVGGALQGLAHQFRVSLLVVTHTRKSEAADVLDEVSGTTGITGAADAIMVLKRGRGKADGTLTLAGRDIEEQELALKFHPDEGMWELMGEAAEYALSEQRQEIIQILRENGPKTPKELADLLDKKPGNIKKLLWTMAKVQEIKSVNGRYELFKK